MGIVNVTPDSFSGDGLEDVHTALAHALAQHDRSSDVLDIGAESTRPGHQRIDDATEIARLAPVVRAARECRPDAIISADTYKPAVFRAAHAAGADIVNSVWGLPQALLDAANECGAPVAIMHNKLESRYDDGVVDEVLAFLDEAAQRAVRSGIAPDHVILDPGIGFGKTAEQNLALLRSLDRLVALGFPTLIGTSRKSTIGKLTGRQPHERVFGTAATVALAIASGIDMVRVHDVAQMRDVVSVSDAIERDWRPQGWTG
jgi:dihydropteroate synthase